MATATTTTPVLAGLPKRLGGGVMGTIRRTRPGRDGPDRRALARPAVWAALGPLRDLPRSEPAEVARRLDAAAEVLRGDREVLLAILLAPQCLLKRIEAVLGGRPAASRTWVLWCLVAEAAWLAVSATALRGHYAPGDAELLWPIAARQRFLALSEQLRQDSATGTPGRRQLPGELTQAIFGDNTGYVFLARCQEARWQWLRCLDEYESHPFLGQASPAELESELDQIVFRSRQPVSRWMPGEPLIVSEEAVAGNAARLTASDTAVATEVVQQHLLPRFRLYRASWFAYYSTRQRWALISAGATLLTAAGAATMAALSWFVPAAWAAAATFALIGGQVWWFGRAWAAAWLLRLPAAGAVGLVLLVAMAPTWWQSPTLRWQAPAVLVGASFGYLVIEARNHGVGRAAPLRALAVTVVGCGYGLLIALIGLMAVAPSYSELAFDDGEGHTLLALWQDRALAGEAWSVLALATAWCLAVGVFSQILWDDRPITAPLAHLQWRRGRRS